MREARLIEVRDLAPDQIEVGHRLRPASEAGVESLMASITELGRVQNEVQVRQVRHQGGRLVLMDGLHRVEACRRLGLPVPAKVWDCSDAWAAFCEVDSNLSGAELGALDTAVFLAARKRIYEQEHPESKAGVAGGLARQQRTEMSVAAFATVTAEKFGLSERQVRRVLAAGMALGPDEVARLRAAPRGVRQQDLFEIAKCGAAPERYHVVAALAEGRAKSAGEARRAWAAAQGTRKPKAQASAADAEYLRLADAWRRASTAARRRWVAEFADDVLALEGDAE